MHLQSLLSQTLNRQSYWMSLTQMSNVSIPRSHDSPTSVFSDTRNVSGSFMTHSVDSADFSIVRFSLWQNLICGTQVLIIIIYSPFGIQPFFSQTSTIGWVPLCLGETSLKDTHSTPGKGLLRGLEYLHSLYWPVDWDSLPVFTEFLNFIPRVSRDSSVVTCLWDK